MALPGGGSYGTGVQEQPGAPIGRPGSPPPVAAPRNGASTVKPTALMQSPIEQIRQRNSPAGERGQTRSAYYWYIRHHIGLPNPDRLDAATYRKMEFDPQVKAGVMIREFAILGKPPVFNYTARDPKDPVEKAEGERMVSFLDWVWRRLQPNWLTFLRNILSARRFGFAVVEKVWSSTIDANGDPALRLIEDGPWKGFAYIEKCKLLPPESVGKIGFATDEYGNMIAVIQNLATFGRPQTLVGLGGVVPAPWKDYQWRIVFAGMDLDRLIIYTANYENGNHYGTSDLQAAYNHWYSKQTNLAARNVLLERTSGILIGKYDNADSQERLQEALDNVGPGAILTVPKESEVALLEGWEQAIQGYQLAIEYDDRQILQSLLVPPLVIGGQAQDGGSYARAASDFNSFMQAIRSIQLEVETVVERQFIAPLIKANFGNVETMPTFDFPELQEKDRSRLADTWQKAVDTGYVDPAVDAWWMRQEMGVPEDAPGHLFQKPQAQVAPFGQSSNGPDFGGGDLENKREDTGGVNASLRAQKADTPAAAFEAHDSAQAVGLVVDNNEAKAKAAIGEALMDHLHDLLLDAPKDSSEGELGKLDVEADWFTSVLDGLGEEVLQYVMKDMARKFQASGKTDVARRLSAKKVRAAKANEPAQNDLLLEALAAYREWARKLNQAQGDKMAAELAGRLRLRVIQAYALGLTPEEVGKRIADEFSTYVQNQVQTVARTTVMDLFNSARETAYEAAGDYVLGLKFVPVLDKATTPFCRAIQGRSISKQDPLYQRLASPPFDYNCRTMTVPVTTDDAGWRFDTDWQNWLAKNVDEKGGQFIGGA